MDILQDAIDKVKDLKRIDLLKKTDQDGDGLDETGKTDLVSLLTMYTSQCDGLAKLLKKNWGIVQRSSTTKQLAKSRLVVGYRRPKNLRGLLVRAKLPQQIEVHEKRNLSISSNSCKTKNCRYCPILDKTGRIKSHVTGREYQSKINVTCKSSNLIYCITCKTCGMQYVGQTKLCLMDRFGTHFTSNNRYDGKNDVCKHFKQPNHSGAKDLKLHIVDFIFAKPESEKGKVLRDHIEFNWIQRLRTQLPHGINTMDKSTSQNAYCRNWKNAHV